MRTLLIPLAALALIGAKDEAPVDRPLPELPATSDNLAEPYKKLLQGKPSPDFVANSDALRALVGPNCRDRMERAQDEEPSVTLPSFPLFQRAPDTPDNSPLAIYAVDRRENGCGVMVVMGNPEDVRPLPKLDADDHRLMPAEGDRED